MHVHLCVALWLFSSPVSFSSLFRCSSSGPSRCLPPSSTRGSSPKTCATSAWGPWPLQTTRHPSHEVVKIQRSMLVRSRAKATVRPILCFFSFCRSVFCSSLSLLCAVTLHNTLCWMLSLLAKESNPVIVEMAQKSSDASDQMTSLQCFSSKDMINPDQCDMEPGIFHNWNKLLVSYVMSIDRKCELILITLQRKDATLRKDISCIQDEWKMLLEIKNVANHVSHVSLLGLTRGKAKGRVISKSSFRSRPYRQVPR